MEDHLTAEEALILAKKPRKELCEMELPEILNEIKNAAIDGNIKVVLSGRVRPYIADQLVKLGYSLRERRGMLSDKLYTDVSWYPNENEISEE